MLTIYDVTGLMKQLEDWGGKPDKKLPIDPAEYAARMCILKNKNRQSEASCRAQDAKNKIKVR